MESATVLGLAVGAALLADPPTKSDAGKGEWGERAEVHQATGMVVAQLGIGAEDATALLRAHAIARYGSLVAVSTDVVDRRLVFSASPDQEIETT
ncbi:MAG: ANTAR domain-containing protein [Ornithinibacter sp.]